jgi:hypothetical protein
MPGETKIFKNHSGWYDVDNPGVYHATREECRQARKGHVPASTAAVRPSLNTNAVADTNVPDTALTGLTGLQQRLLIRLTSSQGVSQSEALEVIRQNGYNKAASYGHMRAAGAGHFEALQVIYIGSPTVSLSYGKAREDGFNHVDALTKALDGYPDFGD